MASAVAFFSPLDVQEKTGLGLDKLVHVILFGGLAISGIKAFPKKILLLIVLLLAYTVFTEVIQGNFIPHRSFDIYDIISDVLGITAGVLIYGFRDKRG